jgi:hypothetical protein
VEAMEIMCVGAELKVSDFSDLDTQLFSANIVQNRDYALCRIAHAYNSALCGIVQNFF